MLHLPTERSHPLQLSFLVVSVLSKLPQVLLFRQLLLLLQLQARQLLLLQQTQVQSGRPDSQDGRRSTCVLPTDDSAEGPREHLGGQQVLLAADLLLLPGGQVLKVAQSDTDLGC